MHLKLLERHILWGRSYLAYMILCYCSNNLYFIAPARSFHQCWWVWHRLLGFCVCHELGLESSTLSNFRDQHSAKCTAALHHAGALMSSPSIAISLAWNLGTQKRPPPLTWYEKSYIMLCLKTCMLPWQVNPPFASMLQVCSQLTGSMTTRSLRMQKVMQSPVAINIGRQENLPLAAWQLPSFAVWQLHLWSCQPHE